MTTERVVREAIRLVRAGQLAEAEALCGSITPPQAAEAALSAVRAVNAAGHGNDASALQYVRQAVLDGDFVRTSLAGLCVQVGNGLWRRGREAALAAYFRALALSPSIGNGLANAAVVLANRGHAQDAIELYERAVELDPGNARLRVVLARNLANRQMTDRAIVHFEHAMKAGSAQADVIVDFGDLQMQAGRLDVARALVERSIELDPAAWAGHFKLGVIACREAGSKISAGSTANAFSCIASDGVLSRDAAIQVHDIPVTLDAAVDMADVTFALPFRRDSDERVENLAVLLAYLSREFPASQRFVYEEGERKTVDLPTATAHRLVESGDGFAHKTSLVNRMARDCSTGTFVSCDVDVIVPRRQMLSAIYLIQNGLCDLIYPFDGSCLDLDRDAVPHMVPLDEAAAQRFVTFRRPHNVGSCVVWSRQKFAEIGMENETFKIWGQHDGEILHRAIRLGLRVGRVLGNAYHLNHPRAYGLGIETIRRRNFEELDRVKRMSTAEMRAYVETMKR
ncbi:MAG: tetratricopeptide repeat protein [Alphaproteobacteria bacterium]|nr:tetratricopeptide repeat protein [Alphaproteobacteria bacterium]